MSARRITIVSSPTLLPLLDNPFWKLALKLGKLVHSQPSGSSNGLSSSLIGGNGFCFFIFPSFTSWAFSCAIRLSSSEAGSSFGSCGTSLPITASCRMVCFNASTLASVVNRVSKCSLIRAQFSASSSAFWLSVSVPNRVSTSCWCASRLVRDCCSSWSQRDINWVNLIIMRSCSCNGGKGIGLFSKKSLGTRFWPAEPVICDSPDLRKLGDLKFKRRYFRLIISLKGRATCNSVVPTPMPFFKPEKIAALLFSKQGVIFAIAISPLAKCV